MKFPFFALAGLFLVFACQNIQAPQPIDRKALVSRHQVQVAAFDSLSSLSVGNGKFAFTADITGLQTYPEHYQKGVALGTFSEWGWHSFPNSENFRYEETLQEVDFHGRPVSYDVQWKEPERHRRAADYFRQNPHRLHLGQIGFELFHADGNPVPISGIANIQQRLDLWEGTLHSHFTVDGVPVEVTTVCHPDQDLIAARIQSPLLKSGRLRLKLSFPYPSGGHVDDGCNWQSPDQHSTSVAAGENEARITRQLDSVRYFATVGWEGQAKITQPDKHRVLIIPGSEEEIFSFSCRFSENENPEKNPLFSETAAQNREQWKNFWQSGGAVDFAGSTDPRAAELERRVVLSQYLTRIQCEGKYPPQETGLTFNSWYGKFHTEMHWWHAVHFALWNRIELMEKSLDWYRSILPQAGNIARRQGFAGVRWPKMTGPNGIDSPSSVGSFLIWQQPHFIYFAELCYRNQPDSSILKKYSDIVFATAEFMASYAWYDATSDRYLLGPWLIPAQERLPAATTINPPYELAYWRWGLTTAQLWRERLQLPRVAKWDEVLQKLPAPAHLDGLYLAAESAPDTYRNPNFTGDHPAVLAAPGVLPSLSAVDETIMRKTFDHILQNWQWESTWGWDFPVMAMSATRLGMPEKAVDALLMPVQKNSYLPNGHNYQDQRLRIYLPGNGGLLAAVAMMCAGYDGCTTELPGFPKDGSWKVKWENLQRMP